MKKHVVFVLVLLIPNLNFLTAQGQGDQARQEWVARNGGGTAITLDARGNVYVAGTAKYDPHGTAVWVARDYDASLADIAVDARGNVYVTGGSSDYVTIKYDPQGK